MFLLLFLLNLSCNPFSNDSSLESNRGYSVNRTVKLESDSDKVIIADGEDSIYLSAENYQLYYKENGIEKRVEQNMFSTKKGGIYNFYTKDRVKVQGSVIAISKNVLKDEYSMYVKDVEKTKDKNYFNLNNRYRKYFSYRIEDINKDEKDIRDNLDDNSLINALENNLNDVEYISQEVEVYVRDRVFKKIKITIHSIDIMYSIDDDSNESSIFAKPGPILVNAKDNNSSIKFRSTRNISADISSMENITYQDGKMTFDLKKGVNRVKFYFYEEKKRVDFAEKIIYNLDIPEVIYPENKNYVMYGETCNINIDDFIKNVGEDKIKFSEETEKQFITYIENNSIVCTPALIKGHKNPDEEVVVDVEIKYLNDVILTLPIKVKGYAEKNLSKWPGLINGGNYCYYNAGLKGFLAAYGDLIKINNKDEEIKDTTKRILKSLWSAMNLGNKDAIRRGYAENDKGLWYLLRDYLNENSKRKIKNVQEDSVELLLLPLLGISSPDFSFNTTISKFVNNKSNNKKVLINTETEIQNYINIEEIGAKYYEYYPIFGVEYVNSLSLPLYTRINDLDIDIPLADKFNPIIDTKYFFKYNDEYYLNLASKDFIKVNESDILEFDKDSGTISFEKFDTELIIYEGYYIFEGSNYEDRFIKFCEQNKQTHKKVLLKNNDKYYEFYEEEKRLREIRSIKLGLKRKKITNNFCLIITKTMSADEFKSYCQLKENIDLQGRLILKRFIPEQNRNSINEKHEYFFFDKESQEVKKIKENEISDAVYSVNKKNKLPKINLSKQGKISLIGVEQYKQEITLKTFQEGTINRVPEVLTLIFKRFLFDGFRSIKQETSIDLQQSIILKFNNTEYTYELTSAIYHSGRYGGGHYISYIKYDDKWYQHNDSIVEEISNKHAEQVLKQAYALFYKLKETSSDI
jgi:hypothetical protein